MRRRDQREPTAPSKLLKAEEKTARERVLLPAIPGERAVGPAILLRKGDLQKPELRDLLLSTVPKTFYPKKH